MKTVETGIWIPGGLRVQSLLRVGPFEANKRQTLARASLVRKASISSGVPRSATRSKQVGGEIVVPAEGANGREIVCHATGRQCLR